MKPSARDLQSACRFLDPLMGTWVFENELRYDSVRQWSSPLPEAPTEPSNSFEELVVAIATHNGWVAPPAPVLATEDVGAETLAVSFEAMAVGCRTANPDWAQAREALYNIDRMLATRAGGSIARSALDGAEAAFLEAAGWMPGVEPQTWHEPPGRKDRVLSQGHAVNSQKGHDRLVPGRASW